MSENGRGVLADSRSAADVPTVEGAPSAADVDAATRRARLAAVAAAPALRRRAITRSRRFRFAMRAVVALVAVLVVVLLVLSVRAAGVERRETARAGALDAAVGGVGVMLTADPDDAVGYAEAVLAVSAGEQRDRLEGGREQLVAVVSGLTAPSVGRVLEAGLITDPTGAGAYGSRASVLLVAETSNPELLGLDSLQERLTLRLELVRTGDGWKIVEAGPA